MDALVAFIRDAVDGSGSAVQHSIPRPEHTRQKQAELFRSRDTGSSSTAVVGRRPDLESNGSASRE
jgi:hypothetical protein